MSEPAPTDADKDTLRLALQALAARLGKTPTVVDMHREGDYHPEVYVDAFGGWEQALEAAGLDPEEMGAKKYSDYDLLSELQRLAEERGHPPTKQEMRDHGKYSDTLYRNRFGTWNQALQEAMLDTRTISDQELLKELQRLAGELGKAPTVANMDAQGQFAPVTYHRRFGSWTKALNAAGLD